MGVQFEHKRIVTIAPFVADPDPNTSPPTPANIFALKDRPPYAGLTLATAGNTVFLDFRNVLGAPVSGPFADWQTWFLDDASGVWTNALTVKKSKHLEAWITRDIKSAQCFVQVQTVSAVGTAVTVTVRMMEV